MTRPVIGINCELEEIRKRMRLTLCDDYIRAVTDAGGLPVALPHLETEDQWHRALELVDGLVLSGGDDLHPSLYGQAPHPSVGLLPERKQRSDLALMNVLFERKKPALGICYGAQLLSVWRGGSLVQDIPTAVGTAIGHSKGARHDVDLEPSSRVARILGGTRFPVRSWHHQAVENPGRHVRVVARSGDGVVEAVEDEEHPFFLAVQWHPERMHDAPEQARLFAALIEAASRPSLGAAREGPGCGGRA